MHTVWMMPQKNPKQKNKKPPHSIRNYATHNMMEFYRVKKKKQVRSLIENGFQDIWLKWERGCKQCSQVFYVRGERGTYLCACTINKNQWKDASINLSYQSIKDAHKGRITVQGEPRGTG